MRGSFAFIDANWPTCIRSGSGFCKEAIKERSRSDSSPRQALALLCHTVHQVSHNSGRYYRPGAWLIQYRTNIADGLPPTAESLLDCDERDRENMVPYLPADLQFLHKTYIISLRAVIAISKTNVQSINCDVRVLRSLIGIFDQQLLSLSQSSPGEIGMSKSLLICQQKLTSQTHYNSIAHAYISSPSTFSLIRLTQALTKKVWFAFIRFVLK